MSATKVTILNLFLSGPSRPIAPLFAFFLMIARNVASRFQLTRTAPQPKILFSFLASCRPPPIGQERVKSGQRIFGLNASEISTKGREQRPAEARGCCATGR